MGGIGYVHGEILREKRKGLGLTQALADCGATECRAFALGEYWAHVAPLELAVARRDAAACLAALTAMLEAADELWSIGCSPMFPHLKRKTAPDDLGTQLFKPLLLHLEQGEEYAFLHGTPKFEALVCRYRGEQL